MNIWDIREFLNTGFFHCLLSISFNNCHIYFILFKLTIRYLRYF